MSPSTFGGIRSGLALCAAGLLWMSFGAAPARAGDDGAAPLWVGLGSIVGFGGPSNDEPIEYRDHARLVLPPKADLPPPVASSAQGSAGWPVDPDLERRKREKAERDTYFFIPPTMRKTIINDPNSKVTVSATAGHAPGEKPCVNGPGEKCQTRTSPSINWNPLTWVGLEKKPQTVLGPEPDRDWLTDPPKGYREPAEGENVKMDN